MFIHASLPKRGLLLPQDVSKKMSQTYYILNQAKRAGSHTHRGNDVLCFINAQATA